MSYVGRLTDSCVIKRAAAQLNELYQPVLGTPADVATVDCRLVVGAPTVVQRLFGADFQADGVVYFDSASDIRPTAVSQDAKGDLLTITQRLSGAVSSWWVVAAADAAQRGRGVVAAVRRWSE